MISYTPVAMTSDRITVNAHFDLGASRYCRGEEGVEESSTSRTLCPGRPADDLNRECRVRASDRPTYADSRMTLAYCNVSAVRMSPIAWATRSFSAVCASYSTGR